MKSKILGLFVLVALGLAAVVSVGSLRADQPALCQGAVSLRQQLQTFTKMRFYLVFPSESSHTVNGQILHLRNDGAVALDDTAGGRLTWDGTTLWTDLSNAQELSGPQPPMVYGHNFDPYINPLFQALRSNTIEWIARGPGYYGWSSRNDTEQYAELISDLWDLAGYRVFLKFGGSPQVLYRVVMFGPSGKQAWQAGVVRYSYNPTLPNAAFSKTAPPQPVWFPTVCPDGLACPESQPPGPIGG